MNNIEVVVEIEKNRFTRLPIFEGKSLLICRYSPNIRQDIIIKDPTKMVSPKHIVVSRVGEDVKIKVLGINGVILKRELFKMGDTVTIHPPYNECLMIVNYRFNIYSVDKLFDKQDCENDETVIIDGV